MHEKDDDVVRASTWAALAMLLSALAFILAVVAIVTGLGS